MCLRACAGPPTESLAKVLAATGVSFGEFATMAEDSGGKRRRGVPLLGFAQAGDLGFFDDAGFPVGQGWDEIDIQGDGEGVYALEIAGDSMLPVYRAGDRILVQPTAEPRRGDRVVVKTQEGEVMAKEVERVSAKRLELLVSQPRLSRPGSGAPGGGLGGAYPLGQPVTDRR